MIRVTLKGLLGRKLRLALTSLAIVLGVGMVSGTYVLTDTINAGIGSLLGVAYAKTDAVVTGKAAFGKTGVLGEPSFPASTLQRIERLPAVAAAAGGVRARAEIVGVNGKVISRGSTTGYGFSIDPSYARFSPLTLVVGSWPTGPAQVTVDAQTAASQHLAVGDHVGIIVKGGREQQDTLTGVADYGGQTSLAGATLAIFDLPVAQSLFGKQREFDQIDVAKKAGVSDSTLLSQIRSVLPAHTQVRTGQQEAQAEVNNFSSALQTFRYFLLAFGGIALFVGAFVIANTLSITVAQRAREFATLRTIGATSRQVREAVMLEGLATGLVASVIGLFVGLGLAKALEGLFKADGIRLPLTGLVFATRTVIVSLVVGIVVTFLASLWPALRATRVPPIAAVREGSVLPPSRLARFGPAFSLVVLFGRGRACLRRRARLRPRDRAAPASARRRGARGLLRCRDGRPADRPAAGGRPRLACGQDRRRRRDARALQRDAQPVPHRLDRRRSHDRARARERLRRARTGPQTVDHRVGHRRVPRRLRPHLRKRLQTHLRRLRERHPRRRGRDRRRRRAFRAGPRLRPDDPGRWTRPRTRPTPPPQLEGRHQHRDGNARSQRSHHRQQLREHKPPNRRLADQPGNTLRHHDPAEGRRRSTPRRRPRTRSAPSRSRLAPSTAPTKTPRTSSP